MYKSLFPVGVPTEAEFQTQIQNITKMNEVPFGYNTAVTLIEFEDDLSHKVKFCDDASHITDELMNKEAAIPIK